MNLKWSNPVVVITGASSGIGKATARRFAEEGARLVLAARRKNLLEDLVEECEEMDCEALAIECDVSDESDVRSLAKSAVKKFGQIDIWINDAGVGAVGRFDEIPLKEHEQLIQTNLMGVIYGSHVALRHFRERGQGVLINIASVEGKQAIAYHASYAATKHAIVGLDSALRQELRLNDEDNIHVCTVMPASINTPFFEHAANHTGRKVSPVPPVYSPERVADTIFEVAYSPKDEVYAGGIGKVIGAQKRMSRKLSDKQMGFMQHREQMQKAPPADNHSGSIFSPMDEGTEASSEWRETGKYVDTTGVAVAALVPIVGGLWLWRRMRTRTNNDHDEVRGVA